MRVCFFIPSLGDGGAQRQCIALLNVLQQNSTLDLHLILLGAGEHDDSLDTRRITLHRTEVSNFASPQSLLFATQTIRRIRPDLVISWLHPADIWSYVATRLVRGVPWVLTERGSVYPDSFVFNLRKRMGSRSANSIIANSEAGKRLWASLAPRGSVQVIPNMVINQQVQARTLPNAGSAECLIVGRLEAEKNVSAMTAAFARFAQLCPESRLTVVGKGSQAEEISRIGAGKGVADRITLLGFRKDIPHLMSRARLLLSFSHYEGMPNVVMEAVCAGLPAVVSDIPEHRALLGDSYPYFVRLDRPTDEAAGVIAKAWVEGASHVEKNYDYAHQVLASSTPERIASAYLQAFTEIVAGANPPMQRRARTHRRRLRT